MNHDLSPIRNLDRDVTHRFYLAPTGGWYVEGRVIKVTENGDYWVHRTNGRTSIIPHHAILRIDLEV